MSSQFPLCIPLGDAAILFQFSHSIDLAVNAQIQQVAFALRQRQPAWVRDIVPALTGLAIHYDLSMVPQDIEPATALSTLMTECLARRLPNLDKLARTITVPVCYDPSFGLDLEAVAEQCKLSIAEVITRHCASAHRVLMVGFSPGHPYIGGLDARLSVPRLTTPRPIVQAGSVAIANTQSVVYPWTISGGWSILGRSPMRFFNPDNSPPTVFSPGDRVQFVAISRAEYEQSLQTPNR